MPNADEIERNGDKKQVLRRKQREKSMRQGFLRVLSGTFTLSRSLAVAVATTNQKVATRARPT